MKFKCESCGKVLSVRDEFAGRQAKCGCGAVLTIPTPEEAARSLAQPQPGALVSKPATAPAKPTPPPSKPPAAQADDDDAITLPGTAPAGRDKPLVSKPASGGKPLVSRSGGGAGKPLVSRPTGAAPTSKPAAPKSVAPPADDIEELGDADLDEDIPLADDQPKAPPMQMAPMADGCPHCRSPLPPGAVLCVVCGYNLRAGTPMQTMVMAPQAPMRQPMPARSRTLAKMEEDDPLSGVDILMCIFCGTIAIIVGIFRLIQGRRKNGLKMILIPVVLSLISSIIGIILGLIIGAVGQGQ